MTAGGWRSAAVIESVIGTVQREPWEVVHFEDVAEAERALATFFVGYNHLLELVRHQAEEWPLIVPGSVVDLIPLTRSSEVAGWRGHGNDHGH